MEASVRRSGMAIARRTNGFNCYHGLYVVSSEILPISRVWYERTPFGGNAPSALTVGDPPPFRGPLIRAMQPR